MTCVISLRDRVGSVPVMTKVRPENGPSAGRAFSSVSRTPEWLSLDIAAMSAKVNAVPTREQIDTQVEEALIVEFYSR